jgi:transcriptional regulator with PAS, ATPase and Fis domain
VDVRIIAATNHDLSKMVEQKRFRTDLYHRLNIFSIDVPPLRERLEDVPLLVDHFIKEIAKKAGKKINRIDTKVFKKLTTYNFPGNVRELKNMIERAVILSDSEVLDEDCFISFSFLWDNSGNKTGISDDIFDLATIEKNHIIKILKKTKHNKSKAAGLLNISRQALDRKIEKYNI